jgi:hypothetical protein
MGCSSQPKSATIWPPYRITKDTTANQLTKQLDELVYGKLNQKLQYIQLEEVLKNTKPQDAAVLWNALPRLPEHLRGEVRNRLAKLLKQPPRGPAFDSILTLDKDALDAWWQAIVSQQ